MKKLEKLAVFTITPVALIGWAFFGYTELRANQTQPAPIVQQRRPEVSDFPISELVKATNDKRAENGLAPLTENPLLDRSAQNKCNDMIAKNYWSHNSPDGAEPWVFIQDSGYKYTKAGENLGFGFKDTNGVMDGWMKSQTHRNNIVSADYKEVGFGVCSSENYQGSYSVVIVQHFGKPQ